ncbi:MAG: hypothetical protein MRZ79_15655 [Bacteroidia bacterium]|nr:hypothetical protein [Bacteroidia bacterium]
MKNYAIIHKQALIHGLKAVLNACAILLLIPFIVSCNNDIVEGGAKPSVHVAFAGGGWRAHTGHSGWVISLLQENDHKLDSAFSQVEVISSNSGGSWFSTMLMYSDTFANAIQAPNALMVWDSSGWLGKQKVLFDNNTSYSDLFSDLGSCLEAVFNSTPDCSLNWKDFVYDFIYKGYRLAPGTTLSSNHLDWAADKPLLLAATMLTDNVVVNTKGEFADQRYYQACLFQKPSLDIHNGGKCSSDTLKQVIPVVFSSIPQSQSYKAIPFLPSLHSDTLYLGYTASNYLESATKAYNHVLDTLDYSEVDVMTAAATSSAALGFLGSESVAADVTINLGPIHIPTSLISWFVSGGLQDEALSFQLFANKVKFLDAEQREKMGADPLANTKVVRLADGGPVDNTGVAQLVSSLQANGKDEGFDIVAFDNVTTSFNPGPNGAQVGGDIAYLFGKNLPFCADISAVEICIDVPDLQIFKLKALTHTPHTWKAYNEQTGDTSQKLIYTKYTVETVDNNNFGIEGGKTGTLHSFSCIWPGASTAPASDDDFDQYSKMLQFINRALKANDKEGLNYLQSALHPTE